MLFWSLIYLTSILIANYMATWFFSIPIMGFISVGTIVFGVTFTARDFVHKLGGVQRVYTMIIISIIASSILSLVADINMRIIIASGIAIGLSEFADTEIYRSLESSQWVLRVIGSNLVSIPIDTIFFNVVAFLFILPNGVIAGILWGEITVKFLVGLLVVIINQILRGKTNSKGADKY